jgi:gluconolactonase
MKIFAWLFIILLILTDKWYSQEIVNKDFEIVASNQQFPEGVAWDGISAVFSSNCYGNWITKINKNKADTFLMKPTEPFNFGKTNGLTFDKYGNLFACDYEEGKILKISPQGKCEVYADGFEGQKFNRPNDLAFDENGNLFFTDPKSYGKDLKDGRIFMIENKTKKITLLWDSLAFLNGIAISENGRNLFVCESAKNRILKFSLTKTGKISNPQTFAELPGGDPDGIAFDKAGNLYAAHFGGQAIYVISPEGKIMQKILTPGKKPSNVEFGGKDMKDLYISEDETNSVYRIKTEIPGLKLFYHK